MPIRYESHARKREQSQRVVDTACCDGVALVQNRTMKSPLRLRGMTRRLEPITARTTTTAEASQRLFGDDVQLPIAGAHRGELLRYVLRGIYGADYRRRGAALLGIPPQRLSAMMSGGLRVSRRIVDRLESKLADRIRERRKELRALAGMIEEAFALESERLASAPAMVSTLARLASEAMRVPADKPRSDRGRFVPRVQSRIPLLREKPGSPGALE